MTRSNRATMDDNSLENAGAIIERFGGIRPMAKKIEVAVTTIQGWKKRDVIPATRREQVLQAAATHNVDLSDIIKDAPQGSMAANQNTSDVRAAIAPASVPASAAEKPFDLNAAMREDKVAASIMPRDTQDDDLDQKLAQTEKRAVKKSTWINGVLIILALASAVVLLWPTTKNTGDERIDSLEQDVGTLRGDVDAVKAEQSFLSTLIPKDLDDRIAKLQQQARETQEKVSAAFTVASEISQEVMAENAGTVGQRMEILGQRAVEAAATPEIAALLQRFQNLSGSVDGEAQLNQAVAELNALVSSLSGQAQAMQQESGAPESAADQGSYIDQALIAARDQSTTLSQTFEGVPAQDMKAAALLLGMTQFRQSLNRDNTPFQDDMQLLVNLVGEDNPELLSSLERLAPQAESGVLTPGGLTNEFKTMAGEAVVASLRGEDVSIQDRARARMNELFAVEKNGELLTGTPEQATMAKAENLLSTGDVAGAISEVETLQGPAAEVMMPWLEKARATLQAQNIESMLSQSMEAVASGTSQLIQNKDLGINILRNSDPLAAERMQKIYE